MQLATACSDLASPMLLTQLSHYHPLLCLLRSPFIMEKEHCCCRGIEVSIDSCWLARWLVNLAIDFCRAMLGSACVLWFTAVARGADDTACRVWKEEEASRGRRSPTSPDLAVDSGDGLRSRQIGTHSLAAVLLDGSNKLIGASPMVVLNDSDHLVIAVILIGTNLSTRRRRRSSPPTTIEEDDGAPNLVLQRLLRVIDLARSSSVLPRRRKGRSPPKKRHLVIEFHEATPLTLVGSISPAASKKVEPFRRVLEESRELLQREEERWRRTNKVDKA
ncbi:hypothetical protein ACLOJK_005168 [Asimina triloba]